MKNQIERVTSKLRIAILFSTVCFAGRAGADVRFHRREAAVPAGTKIYIAPMSNHFDEYFLAGLQAKRVPVVVVTDRARADYEVRGFSKSTTPGWEKMLFLRMDGTTEKAAVEIVNLATGERVLRLSAYKLNTSRGMQSTGEALATSLRHAVVLSSGSSRHDGFTANSPIQSLSKVYIDAGQDGFGGYLTTAIRSKGVPLTIVDSRDKAEFELTGYAEIDKATTTQKVLLNDRRATEKVCVQMISLKTGQVVFAYGLNRETWAPGHDNLAAGVAKHLAARIRSDS